MVEICNTKTKKNQQNKLKTRFESFATDKAIFKKKKTKQFAHESDAMEKKQQIKRNTKRANQVNIIIRIITLDN